MTRALQRTIHVACRELGLRSEDRHALQLEVCGKSSMTEMTEAELKAVLRRLKESGFKQKGGTARKAPAPRADLRYIHVLWRLLGEADATKSPGREGLNAFVRSRFEGHWSSVPIDIDTLRDAGQINDVTRALKDWCRREDIATERKR